MSVSSRLHRLLVAATAATLAAAVAAAVVTPSAAEPSPGSPKVPQFRSEVSLSIRPGDSLVSGTPKFRLSAGGLAGISQVDSGYELFVQDDGNVVEYDAGQNAPLRPVWWTGTAGAATPVRLTFQDDRNVVLYDRNGVALWQSGTAGQSTAASFALYGNGQVVTQDADGAVLASAGPAEVAFPGMTVNYGLSAPNPSSTVFLTVQQDGNVVAVAEDLSGNGRDRVLWSTGTAGAGRVRFVAQADGNLVVYRLSDGRAIWQSGSRGPTGYYQFDVQGDGNVVLYRTDGRTRLGAVWASGTRA